MEPAANATLILALLLAVWLGFQFYSRPARPPATPPAPLAAESRLRSVGLADNPDWAGLPELFAVWSDRIEWDNDKTQFAYWNPGSSSYSYYFEVTRANGSNRFRVLSRQEIAAVEDLVVDGKESDTPPFVFRQIRPGRTEMNLPAANRSETIVPSQPPPVKLDLVPAPLPVPPPPSIKKP